MLIILPTQSVPAGIANRDGRAGFLPHTTVANVPESTQIVMVDHVVVPFLVLKVFTDASFWGFFDFMEFHLSHNADDYRIKVLTERGEWLDEKRGIFQAKPFLAMYENDVWKVEEVMVAPRAEVKLCNIGHAELPLSVLNRSLSLQANG